MTRISVEAGNSIYDSRENCNAIIEKSTNTLVVGCQNSTILSSVKVIGNNSFKRCTTLKSIIIPEGVVEIGEQAFFKCGLSTVTIPKSVKVIDEGAFIYCDKLESVKSYISTPYDVPEDVFIGLPKNAVLYVPKGSKSSYEKLAGWKNAFSDIIEDSEMNGQDISVSSSGYATFYSSESAYMLPSGLSASVVTSVANNKLTYRTFAENVVPKGVPVIIESDIKRADTYTLTPLESTAIYSGTNLLRGSDEATTTTGDGYHYKLTYGARGSNLSDVFGWYWGAQNGAPFQIEGHKAWLVVPKSGTRAGGFSVEGEALNVDEMIISSAEDDSVYDLQGRRVKSPIQKGVYIKNGRIIVNK